MSNCLTTGMHNSIFDGQDFAEHQLKIGGQLVKMLITLEPRGIFGSTFIYLCTCIFNIVQPLVCKIATRLHRASVGRSSSFNEKAHIS